MPKCSGPTCWTRGWSTPRGLLRVGAGRREERRLRVRMVAMRPTSGNRERAHPIVAADHPEGLFLQKNRHTRGRNVSPSPTPTIQCKATRPRPSRPAGKRPEDTDRQHDPRPAAEDHVDANEQADYPEGGLGEPTPDVGPQHQADEAVDHDPWPAV